MAIGNGGSKGYNSRAYVSNAPGAFYAIWGSDFGVPSPAAASLTYVSTGGSLATTTVSVKVAWVTAEGPSVVSAAADVVGTTAAGSVTVVQPTGSTTSGIIGWQVYSAETASGGEKLNTTGVTPAPTTYTTTSGVISGFIPVATTTVTLTNYGTGAFAPQVDRSGIQPALPAVTSTAPVIYFASVPNTSAQWKQQKSVAYMRSDGIADPAGLALNHLDFIQPVYPGASGATAGGTNPPSSSYTQASATPGQYMVMNGYLFQAINSVSASTASTFIGWAAFNTTKWALTTDGSVTWQSLGKAGLLRFSFVNSETTSATPAAQSYEVFQQ